MDPEDFEQELQQIQKFYPGLSCENRKFQNYYFIEGLLAFKAIYNNVEIIDEYLVQIRVSKNNSKEYPSLFVVSGRIPNTFHTFENGKACLAAPIVLAKSWYHATSLLWFIENHIVRYLYSYSYFEKNKYMPFEDLEHGSKGIFEAYSDEFDIKDRLAVISLLKIAAKNSRPPRICPCNSGKQYRQCHYHTIKMLIKAYTIEGFRSDLDLIL